VAIANWTCVSWVAYAPGTIAVTVTWIEREFNACQTPRSMYPSIFNHFWDTARYRWWVTGFWQFSWANERFFTTFCFPWVRPWDNRGRCHTVGNRIQCLSNASQHVPICLQPFLRYSELLVENCDIFRPHLCLAAPQGVTLEIRKDLYTHKTRMNGLSCGEESMTIRSTVLIQYQRVMDGQTDGQTSSQYLLRASA